MTSYELANRFGIRMSVARQILREKEAEGLLVPYVKDGGFEAYTSPGELDRKETERPVLIADVLEEVSSSIPKESLFTDEMDAALEAAARMDAVVKPGRLARQRREAGEKKEQRKERRPEVVVHPLESEEERVDPEDELLEEESAVKKKTTPKKMEEKPKKKPDTKEKKKTARKKTEEKAKSTKESPKRAKDSTAEVKPKKTLGEKKPKKVEEKPEKSTKKAKDSKEKKKPKKEPTKAEKTLELTDISGLGSKTRTALAEAGVKTVDKLSKADPTKLATKINGISEAQATKFIAAAQELKSGKKAKPKKESS